MDRPEDVEPHHASGKVYVIMTGSTSAAASNAANSRRPNPYGHVLELQAPRAADGAFDHAADVFAWDVFLLAGDPRAEHGAHYAGPVTEAGWLAAPDNAAIDALGRLWLATDKGSLLPGMNDGLWACDTEGPAAGITRHFYGAPADAEVCGPEFTPDGKTLFLAIQHPGLDGFRTGFDQATTRWPDFSPEFPPRPSVVAVTRHDGGIIGT